MKLKFVSREEFYLYMQKEAQTVGFKLLTTHSSMLRVSVKCSLTGWTYKVSILRPNVNCDFHVICGRVLKYNTRCCASRREEFHPNPSDAYLRSLINPILEENSDASAKLIWTILRRRHGVTCPKSSLSRARRIILSSNTTLIQESGKLADYLTKIVDRNLGNVSAFEISNEWFLDASFHWSLGL